MVEILINSGFFRIGLGKKQALSHTYPQLIHILWIMLC